MVTLVPWWLQIVMMDGPEHEEAYNINKDFMDRMIAEAKANAAAVKK